MPFDFIDSECEPGLPPHPGVVWLYNIPGKIRTAVSSLLFLLGSDLVRGMGGIRARDCELGTHDYVTGIRWHHGPRVEVLCNGCIYGISYRSYLYTGTHIFLFLICTIEATDHDQRNDM